MNTLSELINTHFDAYIEEKVKAIIESRFGVLDDTKADVTPVAEMMTKIAELEKKIGELEEITADLDVRVEDQETQIQSLDSNEFIISEYEDDIKNMIRDMEISITVY